MIINNKSIPVIYADDTSILFTNSNITNYNKDIPTVFKLANKWFRGNFLPLNFEKTHYIHFITQNNPTINMKTGYDNKLIPNILYTKFHVINIDSTLSWRTPTEKLIPKLNTACYVIKSIKSDTSHTTMIMIYYSLFHSIRNFGLIYDSLSNFPQNF